jgi:hypothetical protein
LPEPVPAVNQIEIHPWCQQRPLSNTARNMESFFRLTRPCHERQRREWRTRLSSASERSMGKIGHRFWSDGACRKGESLLLYRNRDGRG